MRYFKIATAILKYPASRGGGIANNCIVCIKETVPAKVEQFLYFY